jgi:hypothetical protein
MIDFGGCAMVPEHQQCARYVCHEPRSADGDHRYCSQPCKTISRAVHGPPLPSLTEWSWAPRRPPRNSVGTDLVSAAWYERLVGITRTPQRCPEGEQADGVLLS